MSEQKCLLIVGAGIYGALAKDVAQSMQCFDTIDFIDDGKTCTPLGDAVIGGFCDIPRLAARYRHIIVAIGNPSVRLSMLRQIAEQTDCEIATLISPRAYVAPSAQIGRGCIIEPMAVVHTGAVLAEGCLVCAGAVVNHAAVCEAGVQVDCNATVAGMLRVPEGTKIKSGTVFDGLREIQ